MYRKRKTILEQELQLTRRNTMLYGSIGFIVMAGIIGLLVFRNQRRAQQGKTENCSGRRKEHGSAINSRG